MRRAALSLLLVAALAASAGPLLRAGVVLAQEAAVDEEIAESKRQLEALKQQAEEARDKVREAKKKEQGVLERVNQADQALAAATAYIKKMESREMELEREIAASEGRLVVAQDVLTQRREALKTRLRTTYMYGRARSLEVMFSADSFADLLRRTAFLQRIVRQDEVLVHKVEEQETEVNGKLTSLRSKRAEVDRLRADKEAEQDKFESLKKERARDLKLVRNERAENERSVQELEQSARAMESVLKELERRRRAAAAQKSPVYDELDRANFAANRGRLPWPVNGDVITKFGRHEHPKYKTVTVSNGIDIVAALGTPVRAVGDGVVDLVQYLPGYGQTVILNHGNGFYTIYGHLSQSEVSVGERVAPGDTIGAVGDTGSLKGPCLHFEVREGGSAQDPMSWMR